MKTCLLLVGCALAAFSGSAMAGKSRLKLSLEVSQATVVSDPSLPMARPTTQPELPMLLPGLVGQKRLEYSRGPRASVRLDIAPRWTLQAERQSFTGPRNTGFADRMSNKQVSVDYAFTPRVAGFVGFERFELQGEAGQGNRAGNIRVDGPTIGAKIRF